MRILPENRYKNNYFTTRIKADTETTIIKVELLRIWGDSIKCRMQELCERLPYIPQETIMGRIRQILKDSDTNGVLFFYELFYEKNEDWLFEGNILSPNMLKACISSLLLEHLD